MNSKRTLLITAVVLSFGGLLALFALNLGKDPSALPSTFIDKSAPEFDLPVLAQASNFQPQQLRGETWLLNVWASWCVSCRLEHKQLLALQQQGLTIVGLNYKDTEPGARQWLQEWEDPYLLSVVDADGRVGIDYGVYGVPETFIIDKDGVIRAKHTGPILPDHMAGLIEQYQAVARL